MAIVSPLIVNKSKETRIKQMDLNDLTYGKIYSDHMFIAEYKNGAWQDAEIRPFGNLELSPSISALHYGQSIFEGLKAFRMENGQAGIFRPEANAKRMQLSAERMGMPAFSEHFFSEGLMELIKLDRNWIPEQEGCSLYIRPVMFATDEKIGVHISDSYIFAVFCTPVGVYFPKPLKVLVESEFVRAADGGVGYAKAAGNYGASMYPSKLAQQKGFDQIIWTDALEHKYVEEAGTMNIMAILDGVIVTPPLSNTTLAGVTRDSLITLAKAQNIQVEERKLSVDELIEGIHSGKLQELFGVGTAATVINIKEISYNGINYTLPEIHNGLISQTLKKKLGDIRAGRIQDQFGWMTKV